MTIAIDLRSVQKGTFSGVENYALSCLEQMIQNDHENKYLLFYNGLKTQVRPELSFLNTTSVSKKIPNKLLALGVTFFGQPDFSRLVGEFDTFFMPNLNHVSLSSAKRLVVTVHDLSFLRMPESFDLKRRFWHWSVKSKKTLLRANTIIAVSEYTKQDLVQTLGLKSEKIKVVHQGVDHSRFHPDLATAKLRAVRNRYGLPGEYILFLGTLEPRKNVEGLLRAWEAMDTDIPLVVAGKPGWKYSNIFRLAAKSRKKHRIQFLGFVEEEDKPYLMKLARTLAFPSFYEGFGLPVLEAMAVGTPVVTSSVTSLPEVVGDAGLLVNPFNLDELRDALDKVCTDAELTKLFSVKGIEQAKKFSWTKTAEETLKVLTNN